MEYQDLFDLIDQSGECHRYFASLPQAAQVAVSRQAGEIHTPQSLVAHGRDAVEALRTFS
jgi:hypothetical protein